MSATAPTDRPPALAAVRLAAFAALGAFGVLHWATLVAPGAAGRALLALAVATAGGLALIACARMRGRARLAAASAIGIGTLVLGLAAAGAPLRLLVPSQWSALVSGIGQGIDALPEAPVPYGGADDWARFVILAGAALLLSLAALFAFWPGAAGRRPRLVALAALTVLYAVPAGELHARGELGRGAAFAALLAAFLWLEQVRRPEAPAGALLLGAAVAVGLAVAPAIDPSHPWLNYQSLAERLASTSGVTFNWDHTYGPYDWNRDGTVLLRIHARRPAYWKTENLDSFDGLRWRRASVLGTLPATSELPARALSHAAWIQRMRVSVRGMRSRDFIGAGTTLFVERVGIGALNGGSPGTYVAARTLKRGDAYAASVYVPQPTNDQLAGDRAPYPEFTHEYLALTVPLDARGVRASHADVQFSAFGSGRAPETVLAQAIVRDGAALLARSPYARAWTLSQRLARQARTPYQYVRNIEDYLANAFRYSETPPTRQVPLESFLFTDRRGYCQHFSGAMALLLRMGGVPARVAAGFTTGKYDPARHDYVVRDFDAHSWVEAYFPSYGWVTFDPTPSIAPARSQALPGGTRRGAAAGSGDVPQSSPRASAQQRHGRVSPALVIGGALLVALAALGTLATLAGRRARTAAGDPWLWELERALRRSGRIPPPGTTLRALEGRFGDDADAAGYLRALREARFGGSATPPSAAQRRALRRELARGLGLVGSLRAAWALPPAFSLLGHRARSV